MVKPIPGFPDYSVSEDGQIISYQRDEPRICRAKLNSNGYQTVVLSHNGITKMFSVHRLVMLAFCGASDLHVNHKNGVKSDNRLLNLEYVTHKENMRHAATTGLTSRGSTHPKTHLTNNSVQKIRALKGVWETADVAKEFGICTSTVHNIWNKATWKYA
jgi:hypothetical protein